MLFCGLFLLPIFFPNFFPNQHGKQVFLKAVKSASGLLLPWLVRSILIIHIHRAELKVTAFIAVLYLRIRQFFLFDLAPVSICHMASCAIAAVLSHRPQCTFL